MANITVTINRSKHPQPYTYLIDKPGAAAKETKRIRYTRASSAKVGAIRSLGARWNDDGYCEAPAGPRGKWYRVEFIMPKKKR